MGFPKLQPSDWRLEDKMRAMRRHRLRSLSVAIVMVLVARG